MRDIYYPSHDGKTTIHAVIWLPEGEIRGVVQIIHGMAEYAARYAPFAEFLTSHGFLVCADDHLGHGQSVTDENELGYFNASRDADLVIADIRALQLAVRKHTGDKPYFIMGHSMGSFFCRKYISLYGSDFSGAVIMGSGYKSKPMLLTALAVVRLNALFCGWRHRSKLLTSLAFGGYNKKIENPRTVNDWLSADGENVESYNADPLCGFTFTDNGYSVLFSIIKQACSAKTFKKVPKDLPVCFVSGADDPVGDYGKGVKKSYDKFAKVGVKDLSITLYEGARHEILNDFCKDRVFWDLLAFFEAHV